MTYTLSERFQKDLAAPAARVVYKRILETMRKLKSTPELPGLHVRSAHLGAHYCKVNDDWRILFRWGKDHEPYFLRVVSHAVFDTLQSSALGEGQFALWETYDEMLDSEPKRDSSFSYQEVSPTTENPLRFYSVTQLRLLGVPKDLVSRVRKASSIDAVLELNNLPEHTRTWLAQLATDPDEPLADPFVVFKQATLEQLEGYCEGRLQDLLLQLASDQKRYVESDFRGPVLLRGCAGSGKSTVGIHRAIRLVAEGRNVLFVTFSPILQQITYALIERVIGSVPPEFQVMHFREWASLVLGAAGVDPDPISEEQERNLIQEAVTHAKTASTSAVLKRDTDFFRDEFRRVIKGIALNDFGAYRRVARYGRQEALSPAGRHAVWKVFEHYQNALRQASHRDWGDYLILLRRVLETQGNLLDIDDVIVDEAQDLTPIELGALSSLADTSKGKTFLMLGDAAQSIYARGFTWKQAGLDVVGRTFVLRRNYRNTREVVRTAGDLVARNVHLKQAGELTTIESVERSGPKPVVVVCSNRDDERVFVVERVLSFREHNLLRLSDIAILAPNASTARQYYDALSVRSVPADLWSENTHIEVFRESVKIMPLHVAKGLEFPVVFVVGMAPSDKTQLRPYDAEDEDAQIEVERNRMLAYVAITRSAEMLFIVTNALSPAKLLDELNYVDIRREVTAF